MRHKLALQSSQCHVRIFTQTVDQAGVSICGRGRNLDFLVVIRATVDQHEAHLRRVAALAHELPSLSRMASGIEAKKISVMRIAEITQY